MRILLFFISLIFVISCGERKEREKETVYNDPRFGNVPCECNCEGNSCGKCPKNCEIKIANNNSCTQKCETDKVEKENQTPIVIIQEQKQDQTSENNNTNDNRSIIAIIEGRYYRCWQPCYSCIPPVEIEEIQDNMKREIYDEQGKKIDCYRR